MAASTESTYRVYETVEIRFARGTRITGYDRESALDAIAFVQETGRDGGVAVATAFVVEVEARFLGIYRPGVDGVDYATEAEAQAVAEARSGEFETVAA